MGGFRETSPVPTPSALYGLVLNLAGYEMRDGGTLPQLELASGLRVTQGPAHSFSPAQESPRQFARRGSSEGLPRRQSLLTHAARSEFLLGLRGVCLVRGDEELQEWLLEALEEPTQELESGQQRYGLPFLGDNNFFLEELAPLPEREESVQWLVDAKVVEPDDGERSLALTTWVDREETTGTRFQRFVCRPGRLREPLEEAWVSVGPGT